MILSLEKSLSLLGLPFYAWSEDGEKMRLINNMTNSKQIRIAAFPFGLLVAR